MGEPQDQLLVSLAALLASPLWLLHPPGTPDFLFFSKAYSALRSHPGTPTPHAANPAAAQGTWRKDSGRGRESQCREPRKRDRLVFKPVQRLENLLGPNIYFARHQTNDGKWEHSRHLISIAAQGDSFPSCHLPSPGPRGKQLLGAASGGAVGCGECRRAGWKPPFLGGAPTGPGRGSPWSLHLLWGLNLVFGGVTTAVAQAGPSQDRHQGTFMGGLFSLLCTQGGQASAARARA